VPQRQWDEYVLELPARASAAAPEGVEIVAIADRPALLPGMYEVATETYHELGGHMPLYTRTFVKWQAHELGPRTQLDLTLVAVAAGGEVIGFAGLKYLDHLGEVDLG
jgi:hypothetical protein